MSSPLPPPPPIALSVERERSTAERGFLNLRRVEVIARYPDGATSPPFVYDLVERRALDAVAIVAYARAEGGRIDVHLRSAPRVPLLLREGFGVEEGNLWEIPAGLVEPGEAPHEAAARELEEELGFRVPASALEALGEWVWPAPGVIAERHFYFCVDVGAVAQGVPAEDGSALEHAATLERLALTELLALARAGRIRDAKTELALRRFAERA